MDIVVPAGELRVAPLPAYRHNTCIPSDGEPLLNLRPPCTSEMAVPQGTPLQPRLPRGAKARTALAGIMVLRPPLRAFVSF